MTNALKEAVVVKQLHLIIFDDILIIQNLRLLLREVGLVQILINHC